MKKTNRRLLRILIVMIAIVSIPLPSEALEFQFKEIEAFRDVVWLGNSVADSAPSPILGVWGAAARFHLEGPFWFHPEIGFYGIEYFYQNGKALPAEIEYADAVGTLGILIDPLLVYEYDLDDAGRLKVGAGAGPAFSFKIPLIPHGEDPSGDVAAYFFGSARFLYFELKSYFDWNITDWFGLTVRIRTLLPVFHAWDGEGSPFYDQLMVGGGIGLRLRF